MSSNKVFTTLGATAHSTGSRPADDYYATDPAVLRALLLDTDIQLRNVWECACGGGHLSRELENFGMLGKSSDLVDRGYGETGVDFLACADRWDGDILTNPPYFAALEFCEHALSLVSEGAKVVMLLRIQFLEGKKRSSFFKHSPPRYVVVSSSRIACAKYGDFKGGLLSSAMCFAWFIWEKGFKGETELKWCN